jgi:uncharacterized protein DUF6459
VTSAVADPPDTSVITIRSAGGTIVVRPAPMREPPFDDEIADRAASAGRYDQPLPFRRPRRRRAPLPPPAASPARAALPDPAVWARRLLLGIIETAGGRRPLNQLTALLSPGVAHGLRTEFELAGQLGRPHWTHRGVIGSVRATEPADQVAEVCATVRDSRRVHAVAIRLEVRHGRWCCTRLVLG